MGSKVEQGVIVPGTKVEILGLGGVTETVVTSVEQFNRPLGRAVAGQNVGLLLRGVKCDRGLRVTSMAPGGPAGGRASFSSP
jgi:elongation factor Tu